tara:strand:- start:372 stop:1430 length:1059 start_codon:yes stop_codon:yes gene_type:complete
MKLVTIIGARPQFIKVFPISRELRKISQEIIIHTGQHYDYNMSKSFFEELDLPKPDYNLGINSTNSTNQIGRMIVEIGIILNKHKPDAVVVYGDTDSTIAGAIAANKQNIKLIHIEAGLRSFDKSMPEEINRVLTDHCSGILMCPTLTAVKNLQNEGITKKVFQTGDVMYDSILNFEKISDKNIINSLNLVPGNYLLATIHRQSNTNIMKNLKEIMGAFKDSKEKIIFPVHPRTSKCLEKYKLNENNSNIFLINPVSYLEMIALIKNAKKILTDSGGLQKEAFFLGVPCITLRENTEWIETIENGWNILVGANRSKILKAIKTFNPSKKRGTHYGCGKAAKKISNIIQNELQ